MGILSEFKQFAVKGNVIDLAVAVVIGAAFGGIVTSLVNDVVMPAIGVATSGVDFSELKIQLTNPIIKNGKIIKEGAAISYGKFIQTIVNFLIIAVTIFALVKGINSLKRKEEAAPATPTPTKQELLLTEIRDLLQERKQL
ncbi:MAG: large conductance mechanosensitive channel protein MscL [Cytophagales bacterium CG18_big_fil_WC_8_21_14_2_50_42_9]|nr:MAG: large conductance mechanosensitive channel protein MscL [Cytophagales bacterium CG18_big_fil_WC_8_21_14_2_50_42_9]